MSRRLCGVIVVIEIASIAALLFLLRQAGLPPKFDLVLVFCLPITFGLHLFEEFIFPDGGADWFKLYHPEYMEAYTQSYFFKINAIPLVWALLVTLGTFDFAGGFTFFGIRAWLAFLTFQAINAIFHIRGSFKTNQYSPGLVTGTLLYLPLTIISFTYLLRAGVVDLASAVVCIAVGALIQPGLDRIKRRSVKAARVQ